MPWRPHAHFRVDAKSPQGLGVCDRCYMTYNLVDLRQEKQWFGPRLMWTKFLVCKPCLDVPQQQLKPRVLPPDPLPLFNPRPENFTSDNEGISATQSATRPIPED